LVPTFGQGFGLPEQFQPATRTLDKPDFKLFILFKDAIIIENRNNAFVFFIFIFKLDLMSESGGIHIRNSQ